LNNSPSNTSRCRPKRDIKPKIFQPKKIKGTLAKPQKKRPVQRKIFMPFTKAQAGQKDKTSVVYFNQDGSKGNNFDELVEA